MHILYFSGVTLPSTQAASVHVMKMAQAFAKAGHDIELYARGKPGVRAEQVFARYGIDAPFTLHLSPFVKIPVYSDAKPLRKIKGRRTKRPDLVFGRDPVALALFCPSDIPILFEADAPPEGTSGHWAFLKLLRQPNFRGIVTQSDVLKQSLLHRYESLSAEQVFVAHDGADLKEFIFAQESDASILKGRPGAFNVGYAGSLHPGKGVELIERIAKICPEYDFHVLGGTKWQLHKLRGKDLPGNMYLYGYKPHVEIPAYLKTFDVVLAPYQHHALIRTGRNVSRWVSPMKLFEYMAAGRPILCSDLPVIHEILTDKKNALLIPAAEEQKWAQKIRFLQQNPAIAARLTEQAHADLGAKYTWDKRALAVLDFFARSEKLRRHARYMQEHLKSRA